MDDFATNFSNRGPDRSLGLVEPELAQMARGNMGQNPMSASTPTAIPMRNYAKGGHVKPEGKKGSLSVTIVSMLPRGKMGRMDEDHERMERMERSKRKHEREMKYDDHVMDDTKKEMKKGGKVEKKACYKKGGGVSCMEEGGAIMHPDERNAEVMQRQRMKKGGSLLKKIKADIKKDISCDKAVHKDLEGMKRAKFAAGGAAKVRKGMMSESGQIKKVVHPGNFL